MRLAQSETCAADEVTATHHAEDVAGRLLRFVHNAVGTDHKLAQVGEFGIVLRKSMSNSSTAGLVCPLTQANVCGIIHDSQTS